MSPRIDGGTITPMAAERETIFHDALELEQSDRAELAKLLIESLDGGADEGVEQAWMAEVDRRVTELENGSLQSVPWDEVKERLRRTPSE
jgi:putative addiction module component (TIGR02574 family)